MSSLDNLSRQNLPEVTSLRWAPRDTRVAINGDHVAENSGDITDTCPSLEMWALNLMSCAASCASDKLLWDPPRDASLCVDPKRAKRPPSMHVAESRCGPLRVRHVAESDAKAHMDPNNRLFWLYRAKMVILQI